MRQESVRTRAEVTPLGSVEQELDRAALSPVLRLLYAMLHNQVMSLGWLRKRGAWKEDPAELDGALRRGCLPPDIKNRNQRVRAELAWERELWGGTRALLDAIEAEGGPRIPIGMVIRGAKRLSAAGSNGSLKPSPERKKELKRRQNQRRAERRRQERGGGDGRRKLHGGMN